MADIFNGGGVQVYYNDDTGNRSIVSETNTKINELASFPTFSIINEVQKIETYDDEYANTIEGQKNVGSIDIVVNYMPTDDTHHYLDKKFDSTDEFQVTVLYNVDEDAGRVENVMMNGVLASRQINGGKDEVVTMTYKFVPTDVISTVPRDIPISLHRGDYGLGANGSTNFPQYEPDLAAGNAFVKISAASSDNPASVNLMGIELVDGSGKTNSNIMMTVDGDLRLYARNNTVPWTRLFTSGESDTKYMAKESNLGDLASTVIARKNLDVYSKGEGDARFMKGDQNLEELSDVTKARTKLDVYSKGETQASFLQPANNLSDILDPAAARANLGIMESGETDAKYLAKNSNLSDLENVTTARTNLGVMSSTDSTATFVPKTITINGQPLSTDIIISKEAVGLGNVTNDAQLKKASNLGDVSSVADCRINIGLGSFETITSESRIYNPADHNQYMFMNSTGRWGAHDLAKQSNIALPIESGGTGALSAGQALVNLRVSEGRACDSWMTSLNDIDYNSTVSFNEQVASSPSPTTGLEGARAEYDWFTVTTQVHADPQYRSQIAVCFQGAYRGVTFTRTLSVGTQWSTWEYITPVSQGGTGATNTVKARENLGLGGLDKPIFYGLDLLRGIDGDGPSGILSLNKSGTVDGAITSQSRLYHEVVGGVARTVLHTSHNTKNVYTTIDEIGNMAGVSSIKVDSTSRTGWPTIELIGGYRRFPRSEIRNNSGFEVTNIGPKGNTHTYKYNDLGQTEYGDMVRNIATLEETKGGMRWNNYPCFDLNNVDIGYSVVGGSNIPNAPANPVFGTLQTLATGGVSQGKPQAGGVSEAWYQQILYSTSGAIYNRQLTNKSPWSGWLVATTNPVSDANKKDILGKMNVEGALDNVSRMDFKLFRYKEDSGYSFKNNVTRRGLISQQLRLIDKQYTKWVGDCWHLDLTPLVLDGLAGVKALRKRDDDNKARITVLEDGLQKQQKEIDELKALVQQLLNK